MVHVFYTNPNQYYWYWYSGPLHFLPILLVAVLYGLIGKSKCLLYEGKGTQTPTVLFSLETLSLGGASKKMTKIEVPSQGLVIPLLYHIQVQYIHVCYVPPKVLFKRSVHRDSAALNYEHFIHAQT